MQAYSDPARATDKHALPDVEVFQVTAESVQHEHRQFCLEKMRADRDNAERGLPSDYYGWYWWACFPCMMPDGKPIGPFDTEAEALADARSD